MINQGALAKYPQVEMLLGALPRYLKANAVMKLEVDLRNPSTFKYNKPQKSILDQCGTTNAPALAFVYSEAACAAPGVCPYSIEAGVPLLQMPEIVNLPEISKKETPAPAQAMEETRNARGENTIEIMIDNLMKAFEAGTFQLSNVNELRYGAYQTARAYPIRADHPPQHTPMNFPPSNAPMGPAYYRPRHNYQQYPWQGVVPCGYCDKLGHTHTFCPNVCPNEENGVVHLTEWGRLTLGPRGGPGGEKSRYWLERGFLFIQEYTQAVVWQGQQGGGVATSVAPQPPQPQHVARS